MFERDTVCMPDLLEMKGGLSTCFLIVFLIP
jgi:hypothetical protein